MIIDLIMIGIICVIIIDLLNAPEEMINSLLRLILGKECPYLSLKKPFGCSLCMTFWIGLIYILIFWKITIVTVLILLVNSILTSMYLKLLDTLLNALESIFKWINTKIK